MKKLTLALALVGSFTCASLAVSVPSYASDAFSFSFNTGNVAFAYSDGYWDRSHTFHKWRNSREAREYRARYSRNYQNAKHNRVKNMGWRGDQDHDGVPNAVDRDRDGDGTPNNKRRD